MVTEVEMTTKGRVTIPAKLRRKFKIEQGTRLEVVQTKEGILFKPKLTMWDLAGSGSKYATVEEMKKLLDKFRKKGPLEG
jgi:AbrB family looped-hinge helix DNA binding protein